MAHFSLASPLRRIPVVDAGGGCGVPEAGGVTC